EIGVQTIVYTDILKDGMLQGPNFIELQAIDQATTMDVIASGGITTKHDIELLKEQEMYGAIIGKALYDGTLHFSELIEGIPMSAKRIVPCLDIDKGRVVKGKKFEEIKAIADPIELAK